MMCLNCACLYSAHVWVCVCVKGDVLPPQILVVSSGGNDGGKILRNGKRINWIIRAGNGKKSRVATSTSTTTTTTTAATATLTTVEFLGWAGKKFCCCSSRKEFVLKIISS